MGFRRYGKAVRSLVRRWGILILVESGKRGATWNCQDRKSRRGARRHESTSANHISSASFSAAELASFPPRPLDDLSALKCYFFVVFLGPIATKT